MACDLCQTASAELVLVREEYQTQQIKMLCPACICKADMKLDHIRDVTTRYKIRKMKDWSFKTEPWWRKRNGMVRRLAAILGQ